MDLKGILSISGSPGLYKLVSQARNAIIVESLETKKRKPAYATHKISALEDIALYTDDGELQLKEVFRKMHDYLEGQKAPSHKSSSNEIKEFFDNAVPEYDEDRVYVSDMKRILNWYNLLHDQGMMTFEDDEEEENQEPESKEDSEADGTESGKGQQDNPEAGQDTENS